MVKVGLYFGTFNPIHIGHLAIANHMVEFSELDEVWMVVTPQNPFKKKASLLDNHQRLEMVYRATEPYPNIKPSDIEFNLPTPNYTIHTLAHLHQKYLSKYQFSLIMGEDNLKNLHKWKNYQVILQHHHIFVYPRMSDGDVETQFVGHTKIHRIDAPVMEVSSTFIRSAVAEGKDVRTLLPPAVWRYIDEMNFYRT